eukprot:CCRYP_013728-RA/>CCRYP_013728-RA protein AED:0.03 eAED:0.03 QI:680/1/1/1/1/1/4/701/584
MACDPADSNRFIRSVDTLFGGKIQPHGCPWFSDEAPLILGAQSDKQSLRQLKQKSRLGLPPQLRCAVWISSVVRVANPHQPIQISDSYGTLGTRHILDAAWDSVLQAVFANPSDRMDAVAVAPDLGLTQNGLYKLIHTDYNKWNPCPSNNGAPIPESGKRSLAAVLCAVQQVLGIEYCPLLPDIACILLTHMPESVAYTTLREMIKSSSYFIPVCQKDYYSWCKSFEVFVMRMSSYHFTVLKEIGVLTPEGLEPMFKRFFTTILKRGDVLHFMDIFVVDGSKAVFRLALSFLQLVPKSTLKSLKLTNAESWWGEIRKKTLHPSFDFKKQLDIMYPKFGKIAKRYPRRKLLKQAVSFHGKWALENMSLYIDKTPPKPTGLLNDKHVLLAKPTAVRSNLAKWLPTPLKTTKLDLIYSTEIHGRSFAAFYKECRRTKHTIILIEAILSEGSATIGMFASHAWIVHPSSFGDGECFLFRADPDPVCYNWIPNFSDDTEHQAIREQFMVARHDFIAMGANSGGTNGLRLDNDLASGESYPTVGFENEPLTKAGHERFEVGVVEVYRMMREVDGKAVDGNDDLIWDLEGI